MQLDLATIRTVVLTSKGRPDRKAHVLDQLRQVNIVPELVDGITCLPGIVGCGLSHLKILRGVTPPCLVLEDDVSISNGFEEIVVIPDKADVVYLGVSTWGVFPEQHPYGIDKGAIATPYCDGWLRVHNMLSGHAILYLSPYHVRRVQEIVIEYLCAGLPFDIGYAALQRQFTALTPLRPFFYQDAVVGGMEETTRHALVPVANIDDVMVEQIGYNWRVKKVVDMDVRRGKLDSI